MQNLLKFKSIFFLSAILFFIVQRTAQAEQTCPPLIPYNLAYGFTDTQTEKSVSKLQDFLQVQGYAKVKTTGIFNKATQSAVVKFQKTNNILSTSGFVGKSTRYKIQELSCYGFSPEPVFKLEDINSARIQSPHIDSVSTTTLRAGMYATITGSNFIPSDITYLTQTQVGFSKIGSDRASANILIDKSFSNTPSQITFTLDEGTAQFLGGGAYYLFVSNNSMILNGEGELGLKYSNAVDITIDAKAASRTDSQIDVYGRNFHQSKISGSKIPFFWNLNYVPKKLSVEVKNLAGKTVARKIISNKKTGNSTISVPYVADDYYTIELNTIGAGIRSDFTGGDKSAEFVINSSNK
jgi:peptidoglycan hydrolase-like protein with peptidoglycan-binding domain